MGSIVYIVPAIVFMIFGSGQVQPWNDPEKMTSESPERDTDKEAANATAAAAKTTITRL